VTSPPPRPRRPGPPPRHDGAAATDRPRPAAGPPPRTGPARRNLSPELVACRLHPTGVLLDVPVAAAAGTQIVVSTAWRDPNAPTGWAHQAWRPSPVGRGYEIPRLTELGDVVAITVWATAPAPAPAPAVEVQAAPRGQRRREPAAAPTRTGPVVRTTWWGYLHAIEHDALVLHGPFPSPVAAYGAAQQAYLRKLQPGTAQWATRAPVRPATPPATVSVTYDGTNTTVGDPVHGWLTVASDRFHNAVAVPSHQLRALLRPHYGDLPATTAHSTLAALAARQIPGQLPDICLPTPTPAALEPRVSTVRLADVTGRPDPYGPNPALRVHPPATRPGADSRPQPAAPPPRRPVPTDPAATTDLADPPHPPVADPAEAIPADRDPIRDSGPFLPDLSDPALTSPPGTGSANASLAAASADATDPPDSHDSDRPAPHDPPDPAQPHPADVGVGVGGDPRETTPPPTDPPPTDPAGLDDPDGLDLLGLDPGLDEPDLW